MSKSGSKNIEIRGARVHNLKNISLDLNRNTFTVFTGLSGSGKSSLAFDTLFAEGQRRYVESLSSYARQFLGKIEKPDVDQINGISPAIAIEQKVNTRNPRSTVGTSTEIFEYLKLLYTRIGKTYSRESGEIVKRHSYKDVIRYVHSIKPGEGFLIAAPSPETDSVKSWIKALKIKGYSRLFYKGEIVRIDDFKADKDVITSDIFILIDRFENNEFDEEGEVRLVDSIETAFYEGHNKCAVFLRSTSKFKFFNKAFELDGISYIEPSVHFFSFNNPLGACKTCEGFGSVIGIDPDLVIPDKSLSIYDGAVACWRGEKMSGWFDQFVLKATKLNFPIHKPYSSLNDEQVQLLWQGNGQIKGIDSFFRYLERKSYKIQYAVMKARYKGKTICPDCRGSRLREETNYVRINDRNISEIVLMPVAEVYEFVTKLKLNDYEKKMCRRILSELTTRLSYLIDVGLAYLNLNRASNSLSGGESQRIQLATSLGSALVGSMYILDEPSIGLHPRDTARLIKVLRNLNRLGNTLIVVEHDEDIIREADEIVDLGPEAGTNGGRVAFQGDYSNLLKSKSLTGIYLSGEKTIAIPRVRRKWRNYLLIKDAYENNLKHIDVKIPLQVLTCVTGVSGSGKSSLVKGVLYKGLYNKLINNTWGNAQYEKIEGDVGKISQIELIDQNPIGKSSRSNPVTYLKSYDEIRTLYASLPEAVHRGYKSSDYSFNVDGGRCDTCRGEGEITVEMQFMSDIRLVCDECHGKRFKDEILEIEFSGKNISDILNLTVDEAIEFFANSGLHKNRCNKIVEKLDPLREVGLGYIHLGQSSSTLSGGEAQRVKLAYFLAKKNQDDSILFLFDEPSTGLHFHDINKLLHSLNALIAKGHTVVIIEHNLEIIKCADWVIDLGPEGGDEGGFVVFEGKVEDIVGCKDSHTAKYLAEKIKKSEKIPG